MIIKKIFLPLLVLSFLISCQQHRHLVFVIDTSGSMQEKNLFQDVKNSIKEILLDYKKGDHISIITFDTEAKTVYDKDIKSTEDIKEIFASIDHANAQGKWTCLVKAMDYSLQTIGEIVKKDPKGKVMMVLYTDGKNDPPPEQGKDPLDFGSLIRKYYKDYVSNKSWYIYYVELDEPDSNLEKFLDETESGEVITKEEFKNDLNFTDMHYKTALIIGLPILLLISALIFFLLRNKFLNTELIPLDSRSEIPERSHSIHLEKFKKGSFKNILTIGSKNTDVKLYANDVAEKHAIFYADYKGVYFIESTSAEHKIFVDGNEINKKTEIKPGQKIQFGSSKFIFEKKLNK